MPDFVAVDPDVLDEEAAYGPEPDTDTRAERLARAFEGGATLRLDTPEPDDVVSDDPTETPRRRRRRSTTPGAPRMTRNRAAGGAQLGSLFMAGFSMLIGFSVGEWAQPTQGESDAIAQPLGNILARRIDIASKLGKDTEDVINLTVALMAYMARVGPVAVGRARESIEERNRRQAAARVDRPPEPIGVPNGRGPGGVAVGPHGGPRTPTSATRSPLDAVAAASRDGLAYLDRDLGNPAGQSAPVVD